ncbi:phospho-N-acetylmuramoyl-pentapeptide-transferase [Candidatus Babeliales bacterium]|nr:phospho-N-acetylmuramoyl-pentapeptide-transferase [Candidatus Babeliales bacterium]
MMYHFSLFLQQYYRFFSFFNYISVRAIAALLSALFLAILIGNRFLRFSEKYFRSKTREYAPSHHKKKDNTPTMGGLFILIVFFINGLFWHNWLVPEVLLVTLSLLFFGMIGFVDDWKKIRNGKGISSATKFLLQLLSAGLIVSLWIFIQEPSLNLFIPLFKNCNPYIGWLLIPWGIFIIVGTSNAVNLTDGLDGLATGPLILNFYTFAIISYCAGHKLFSVYLHMPYVATSELVVLAASLIGGLLGFLWYNMYPAQIFMGDVGSLALGAALGSIALFTRQEFLLVVSGGIFVLETLSVIVQVLSYRFLGRKFFRMAPIHHHFELMGWNEVKITVRFWIISLVLCLLTLLMLKVR